VYNWHYDSLIFFNFPYIGTIVISFIFQINQLNIKFKFLTPKCTSLAENASFDVLIDMIRPLVQPLFAVGDDKKKGKEREGTQSHKTLYYSYLWGGHRYADSHKFGPCEAPAT